MLLERIHCFLQKNKLKQISRYLKTFKTMLQNTKNLLLNSDDKQEKITANTDCIAAKQVT